MHATTDSDAIDEAGLIGARTVAALSLFAANVGMLILFFAFELTLFQLVIVYWWEALWIGLFSGLKLLTASLFGDPYRNRWIDISPGGSFLLSLFAIVKSGGAFLILLALTGLALVVAQQELTGTTANDLVREQAALMLKFSLVFLIGHGLSFIINFLILGEFRRARFTTLLWLPFRRAFGLFVTIAVLLTAIQAKPGVLGYTSFAAVLIVIKLVWDYFLHRRERRSFATLDVERQQ